MGLIGIRIANMALFVLSCSLAANVVNQVGGSMLLPERSNVPHFAPAEAAPEHAWASREAILDRNLFGAQVVREEVVVAVVEPEETLQETKLPLKLLGTISSQDQSVASAAIESTASRKHEVVMVGDNLEQHKEVQVARIDRGRVVLQNGAKREELKLDENATPAPTTQPASKRASRRRSRRSESSSNSMRDRLQDLADKGGENSPAAIFSGARILPKYEDGEMVGIELSKIKPGSMYEKAGLQDGDVLMELNGVTIDNPSASKQLLDAFTQAKDIELKVRDPSGQTKSMNVPSDILSSIPGME
jgi:general secretion pathway protein C